MAAKVLKQFYARLVRTLPMDDVVFIAELHSHDLLNGDQKAHIQLSSLTRAEKADYFLTNVIQPELDAAVSTKKFEDLLEVMSICDQEALVEKIKGMYVNVCCIKCRLCMYVPLVKVGHRY